LHINISLSPLKFSLSLPPRIFLYYSLLLLSLSEVQNKKKLIPVVEPIKTIVVSFSNVNPLSTSLAHRNSHVKPFVLHCSARSSAMAFAVPFSEAYTRRNLPLRTPPMVVMRLRADCQL
ncbi:unnamed protein product, partial [Meganyctiphanes norvegica]